MCYYTVRRVVGKTRHPDRMSQNQTGYVTEEVSDMNNGKIRPPGRQIPIHRKIPTFFRWLTLLAYIYFPMMSEISDTIFRLITPTDIGKFRQIGKFLLAALE